MGGRLDSTNVVSPEISVITNIGMDHTQFLGSKLTEIATEKAGIIKAQTPVVIGLTQNEIKPIFIDRASQVSAPIYFTENEFKIELSDEALSEDNCLIYMITDTVRNKSILIKTPLTAIYQRSNIMTSLQAVKILKTKGFIITDEDICQGHLKIKKQTGLLGRWQELKKNPLTICDIGHNLDGISEVIKQITRRNSITCILL